jgi:cytochrome-b5 reductase
MEKVPTSVNDLLALPTDQLVVVVITVVVGIVSVLYVIQLLLGGGSSKKRYKKFLPQEDFVPIPLIAKEILSHDTARFTYGLPDGHVLGLPTGQHITLKYFEANGTAVQRSYTPVSDDECIGAIQLVIKVYKPDPPKFPEGGKLSQHLDQMKLGDTILVKGPKGHMTYLGNGKFTYKAVGKPLQERSCTTFGMIAGGTGITPMLQVMTRIFKNKADKSTVVKLIYANKSEDDILCREELDALAKAYPDRCSIRYTIDAVTEANKSTWTQSIGFVTKDMISQYLLSKDGGKKQQFLFCGPPPMIKFACIPPLQELGFSDKDWVAF